MAGRIDFGTKSVWFQRPECPNGFHFEFSNQECLVQRAGVTWWVTFWNFRIKSVWYKVTESSSVLHVGISNLENLILD
ncbi:hypothetical protein CEXT_653651 [Caerostris extrusa]|uniref:Uncharacterized protein n=1 Tax=Caerostris extrusa TaxID=172846 RepID=A0AAV4NAY7_CAEEX|nr:hypothetical protein CEXT_653651 [Caerostris extrusa]